MNISLVKIFVLTKNEYDIIGDFLLYYGSIFGFENIVVIDNGSSRQDVLDIYTTFKSKGVTIIVDRSNIMYHGEIMTKHMNDYKDTCKFMIPLDTDEFMFWTDSSDEISRDKVMQYFESIPQDVSIVRFKHFWGSVPGNKYSYLKPVREITDFYDQNWDKVFVRASKFVSMAKGNHHAEVTGGKRVISESLGLLHFHDVGIARQLERCEQAVAGHGFTNINKKIIEKIRDCHKFKMGQGGHHCRQYLRFLARKLFIASWESFFKGSHLPSMNDIRWVEDNHDNQDFVLQMMNYIQNAIERVGESNTDENKIKLLFYNHLKLIPEYKITQVAKFLNKND